MTIPAQLSGRDRFFEDLDPGGIPQDRAPNSPLFRCVLRSETSVLWLPGASTQISRLSTGPRSPAEGMRKAPPIREQADDSKEEFTRRTAAESQAPQDATKREKRQHSHHGGQKEDLGIAVAGEEEGVAELEGADRGAGNLTHPVHHSVDAEDIGESPLLDKIVEEKELAKLEAGPGGAGEDLQEHEVGHGVGE